MPNTTVVITKSNIGQHWSDLEQILNDGQLHVIKWQFDDWGHFFTALWKAIVLADDVNLNRLATAFPDHVYGFKSYRDGSMLKQLKKHGYEL